MTDIQKTSNNNKPNKKIETQLVSDPIEEVELSPQQIVGVLGEATAGSIASIVPGFNKIFEWIERVDQSSRQEKLKALLVEYKARFNSFDDAIAKLKLFTTTRSGQTLFRKIIQIVDKGPEDQQWIHLLAVILKKTTESEFEKYFDAQMFVLSQIDKLSPQALVLISEYEVWKQSNIQNTTTTSGQTMGDWLPQITRFMRQKKNIDNLEVGARINHSFRELESAGMVDLKGHQLKLSAIGLEIHRTITELVS